MKLFRRLLYVPAVALLALAACAKQETQSFDKAEDLTLYAYMQKYHAELLENYQENGGYYVDVIEEGDMDTSPINTEPCWVSYDFSGRNLAGSIIMTRRAREAHFVGTFTKQTRYVPIYSYCGEANTGLLDGVYLAMRNKITLGEEYSKKHGLDREFYLREGSKVVLYMPSRVVGTGGVEGSGGYEGQYTLSSQRPFVVEIEIRDTIKNPLEQEGTSVDGFTDQNGGRDIYNKKDNPIPTDPTDPRHPYNPQMTKRWVSASDSIAQLYVNYRFDPKTDRFSYPNPYSVGLEPYNKPDLSELEQKISDALVKRFHTDKAYVGVAALNADSVKLDGTAKIWYIGRFTDGFVFDSNIPEVREIIYGTKGSGEALSYTPSAGGLIQAFYFVVPHLKFGQWASLITTSTYGYGSSGKVGSSSTTSSGGYSSSYLDYMNYSNYMNSYYGSNGYYGGYYNNYYGGGYYDNYYGDYYSGYDSSSSVNTTTVSTEIPPYTQLIFEFYIEPKE